MPAGHSLLRPLDTALCSPKQWIPIHTNAGLCSALSNFSILLCIIASQPSHCCKLVINNPSYIGFYDASAIGAGRVWFAGAHTLLPTVWQIPWPTAIRSALVSSQNPTGTISNSNLEMAGMLLHYLILEHLAPLRHVHVTAAMVRQHPNHQLDEQTKCLPLSDHRMPDKSPSYVDPHKQSLPTHFLIHSRS